VRPYQPAGVVVDDHGQVLLTLADRDLVEPERRQPRQQVTPLLGLGGDALADTSDRSPRDPHQLTDRGLARVDRQPRGLIVEGPSEPGVVPGPRHRRDHHPVHLALNARRVGLQEALGRAEIQRPPPPAPFAQVIAGAAAPAMRAPIPLAVDRAHRDHDLVFLVEPDTLDDRLLQPQRPRPRTDAYASLAHAATASFPRFQLSEAGTVEAARRAPPARRSGASLRPDLVATKRGTAAAVNQRQTAAHPGNVPRAATSSQRWLTDDDGRATRRPSLSPHPRKRQ